MGLILVGYAFVYFHFRVNGFDLMPNFIGYALIFIGLRGFGGKSRSFQQAKPWILGLGSVALILQIAQLVNYPLVGTFLGILNIGFIAVDLFTLYLIDRGIQELEQVVNENLGAKHLLCIWKLQAALLVLSYGLNFISARWAMTVSLVFGFLTICTNIAFLCFLNGAWKVYQRISGTKEK